LCDRRCAVDCSLEQGARIGMVDHFDPARVGARAGIKQSPGSADERA
jgi:hypothetical protein